MGLRGVLSTACVGLVVCGCALGQDAPATSGGKPDRAHYERGLAIRERAIAYLMARQDPATGAWRHRDDGPNFPAITALVLLGLTMEPAEGADAPDAGAGPLARAYSYLLSMRQPDGGVYDRLLATYNTALSLAAFSRSPEERVRAAMPAAREFLLGLQYRESPGAGALATGEVRAVGPDHPYYGGVGYGGSGRPDNSNLHMFLWALEEAGVDPGAPAVERALVFLRRTQMHGGVNEMPYAAGSTQGGFIYSTGPNEDEAGAGESKAGTIEETLSDGTVASRLRAYGSMTYAGFKSFAYAQLPEDDLRVRAAWRWIRSNYTLEENPGIGSDGYYYYLLTFARALDAHGRATVPLEGGGEANWANDLIDTLEQMQQPDGGFRAVDDRWMEDDRVLITAYALVALGEALD